MKVISSHAEVLAALRRPDAESDVPTRALREETRARFTAEKLAVWTAKWEEWWREAIGAQPVGGGQDLVQDVAVPVCLRMAADLCGLTEAEAAELSPVAAKLFDAGTDAAGANEAALALMARLESPLLVQAFAAFAHTLPAFVGNAWLESLRHPEQMALLAAEPVLLPDAVEELLRLSGPATMVWRSSRTEELRLWEANHDPAVFDEPDRLELSRHNAARHVALGAGPHACAGAALVRLAARAPIAVFAGRFAGRGVRFRAELSPGPSTLRSLRCLTPMLP